MYTTKFFVKPSGGSVVNKVDLLLGVNLKKTRKNPVAKVGSKTSCILLVESCD
jgi:hypothetical protein